MTPPDHLVAHGGHLFSAAEWAALCALRERYRRDPDILAPAERNRLRFVRWMYRVGVLPS